MREHLPVIWLTGLTALTILRLRSSPPAGIDLVLRIVLLGFGAALLVGYPVQDAGVAVTLATLVSTVVAGARSAFTSTLHADGAHP